MSAEANISRADLLWGFLRAFRWLDHALQENFAARGHAPLGSTESQIMLFVAAGIDRPTEIAQQLGVSRQAVHKALALLAERELVALEDDPADGRSKRVVFSPGGEAQRRDAVLIIDRLEQELESRLGKTLFEACAKALRRDWGEPPCFETGD